jgi:lipopolysaccharide transport system permease protein
MTSLRYNLDLLYELTKKELRVRYKSSILGYFWSLLNPLAMAMVFFVAFRVVLKVSLTDSHWPFALFLIAGLFPWQWFSNSIGACTNVYVNNATLIRKVAFRRELLPLATVLNDMFHFLASIPVVLGLLIYCGGTPSWHLLYGLPALMFAQLLLTCGGGLLVSSLNLFFRDLRNVISILLQMLFYVTPVLYDLDKVAREHPAVLNYLKCNPVAPLMDAYRQLLLEGVFRADLFALSLMYGVSVFAIGWGVHAKLKWKFAEIV